MCHTARTMVVVANPIAWQNACDFLEFRRNRGVVRSLRVPPIGLMLWRA
jgi:hypothetical protein